MARGRKPVPKSQREISNHQINPYVNPENGETLGNPNIPSDFRQFTPEEQNGVDFNRSEKLSFNEDTVKPFSVGIQPIVVYCETRERLKTQNSSLHGLYIMMPKPEVYSFRKAER